MSGEDTGRSGGAVPPGFAEALAGNGGAAAQTYLEEATRLTRLQIAQIEEEQRFDHFHHFSAVMKALFEAAVAVFVLAAVAGAGVMVWTAAHDDGLLIQSFSVPQDMAAEGLTGQVVASRLLDRLAQLQQQTQSSRAPTSYANDWGDDIRVQIPETGVSVSQLYTYLSQWLGHQTHISGEIYRLPDGQIAVTARVGAISSPTFIGKAAQFDALLQKAAEQVYAVTQPYRYAVYLMNSGHPDKAAPIFHHLVDTGDIVDKAWAYIGLGSIAQMKGDTAAALSLPRQALAIRPHFFIALENIVNVEQQLQHTEDAHRDNLAFAAAAEHGDGSVAQEDAILARWSSQIAVASDMGDLAAQRDLSRQAVAAVAIDPNDPQAEQFRDLTVSALAGMHDQAAAAAAIAALPDVREQPMMLLNREANLVFAYITLNDWQTAGPLLAKLQPALAAFGPPGRELSARAFTAAQAWVLAETGHVAKAEQVIAPTPRDCDLCLDVRGQIDTVAKHWAAAGGWYALLERRVPDLPGPLVDDCQMRLESGNANGAIGLCRLAHQKAPHWADPLEYWGEALLAIRHYDDARAKFAEAAEHAPNWGRLHLKWAEALDASGKHADAVKQFDQAARLALTGDERAEMLRVRSPATAH